MKKKEQIYVLCDTTVIPSYEDYAEYCRECMDCEPCGENSDDYWDFVSLSQETEMKDLKMNMTTSTQCQVPVIITGSLGLWNGNHEINPVRCDTLYDAIMRCTKSSDDIKVEYQNGVINVYAYHHDGCNCFQIHKLSKRGELACSKWENGTSRNSEIKGYWFAKFHGFRY